jgi:cytochrome c oxidase assembly protein subunit 15
MSRFSYYERSTAVAIWLFVVAALIFAMVVVGGATRLTDSGLSITEWKPIAGAIPPLNDAQWAETFAKYRQIPQYAQVNRGMTLAEFQGIFWWEWAHRFLGRLIGLVFALPLVVFLIRRQIPKRLIWRCVLLLGLGGLQGLVGWWMVKSGLSERIDVAPERLATHLGLALILFIATLWTGLEALSGPERAQPPRGWAEASAAILGLSFVQCLLGAFVAGNDAGFVYTDWPLMDGKLIGPIDWGVGALRAFIHDKALVQFDHRIGAYVLLAAVTLFTVRAYRARMPESVRHGVTGLALVVWAQAGLGIATLMSAVPLHLGVLHQGGAVVVLASATYGLWRMRRYEDRLFGSSLA